jgi:hypothetical protein
MKTLDRLKIALTVLLIACCLTQNTAQTTRNTAQTAVSNLFIHNNTAAKRSDANAKVQYLALQPNVLRQVFVEKPNALQLALPYKGSTLTLDLKAVKLLSQGFYVLQQSANGVDTIPYAGGAYYRGTVAGANGQSLASVSVFADHVVATFSDERGNFMLGAMVNALPNGKKQADASNYVLFNTQDVPNPNAIGCFTDSNAPDAHDIAVSAQRSSTTANDTVRIYLEADNTLYTNFGSTNATADYVTSIFNAVATIYANEQIVLQLAPVLVWAVPDNYAGGSIEATLEAFRQRRTTFDGEQAQLLSLNAGGGIAAGFNTFAGVQTSFAALPTYSWTVTVVAHEFGHCFGSRHTHWCGWQGGPIDGCAGQTEPAPNGNYCPVPGNPIAGGTIMSYCHITSVGVNYANGFGQQPGDRIRACVANRYCAPNSTTGGVSVNLRNMPDFSAPFWSLDGGAWLYNIDVAANVAEGQHIITFKTFPNARPIAPKTIQVLRQQTTVVNAEYTFPSGRVVVHITGGGGAGQWRYSNGNDWHNTGDTAVVPVGTTSLVFKPVIGWTAATLQIPAIQDSVNYTFAAAYTPIPTGKIKIHIEGGGGAARWRYYNDVLGVSPYYNSDDSITVNANTFYTIGFKYLQDWIAPIEVALYANTNQTNTYTATYTAYPKGKISVVLNGANGNGQWRTINTNGWQNSGDTATLTAGQATVIYKNVAGFVTPSDSYVDIRTAQLAVISATYAPTTYKTIRVNLIGGNGAGKWRIGNSLTLHNSGDTAMLVNNNNSYYDIIATALTGWQTPNLINVDALALDPTQTSVFDLTYTAVPRASIRVTLTGDNGLGRWSLDQAHWRNSGDTAQVFVYTTTQTTQPIYFTTVNGYITPERQAITASTLNIAQTTDFTAAYTLIQNRSLKVNIVGGNGQGQWVVVAPTSTNYIIHNSGDTAQISNEFTTYIVKYKPVYGWITPADVAITWSAGANLLVLTGVYTQSTQGVIQVNLTGGNGAGQWRLYDNNFRTYSTWHNSGDTLHRDIETTASNGRYSVEMKAVAGWTVPGDIYNPNTVHFSAAHHFNYTYHYIDNTNTGAQLCVRIAGGNGQGRWTIDGQTLHRSGDTIHILPTTYYQIQYVDVNDWLKPNESQVNTGAGVLTVNGVYTPIAYGNLKVHLIGTNGVARWTLDGTTLRQSGDSVRLRVNDTYDLAYTTVQGWEKPNSHSARTLIANQTVLDTVIYTAARYAIVKVNLTGANGNGRWRVIHDNPDVSAWHNSGDTAHVARHLMTFIEYEAVANWHLPIYSPVGINVYMNASLTIVGAYTPFIYSPLKVNIVGGDGLGGWRISNIGAWRNSGDTVHVLADSPIHIQFKTVNGFDTPSMQIVTPIANNMNTAYAEYEPAHYYALTGNIIGGNGLGQWRIENGAWHNHGDTVHLRANTDARIYFKNIANWLAPNNDTISLHGDDNYTAEYTLIQKTVLQINLTGANGTGAWAMNYDGIWHNSGDTVQVLTGGYYTVFYKAVSGWVAPQNTYYNPMQGGQTDILTMDYLRIQYATLQVHLVNGNNEGLWAVIEDGQIPSYSDFWYNSDDTVHINANVAHSLYFSNVTGWVKPQMQQSITLDTQQTTVATGIYTLASQNFGMLHVNLVGGGGQGQFTINGGLTWHNDGDSLRLPFGNYYSIEWKSVSGWLSPNVYNFELTATDPILTFTGTYIAIPFGILQVNLTGGAGAGQWKIDHGAWHNSGDTLHLYTSHFYTIKYKNIAGWRTPLPENYYPVAAQTDVVQGIYTTETFGTLQVNLTGGNGLGQWTTDNLTWHNSGDIVPHSTNYTYTISYKNVAAWHTPASNPYYPVANQTTLQNSVYLPIEYGTLKVNVLGANGQGQWRINNEPTWRNNGDTLHLLTNNTYTIYYKDITGWNTPTAQAYTPSNTQTTVFTGTYIRLPTALLKVNLTGANGQGLWSIDQLTWHTSGDTLQRQDGDRFDVYFIPVAGWIKPEVQLDINVSASTPTLLTGDYTQRVGTEINAPNFGASLMPNPADTYLRCRTSSLENSSLQLNLYNSIGVLLYQTRLSANDEQTISTSSYPPGFYILQIFDPRTKAAIVHKIIIQH